MASSQARQVLQRARPLLAIAAGAVLGYAYYHFIGCSSGTCPITSNPYVSTMFGAFLGYSFVGPGTTTEDGKDAEADSEATRKGA